MAARTPNTAEIVDDRGRIVPAWTSARRGTDAFEQALALRLTKVTGQRMNKFGCLVGPVTAMCFFAVGAMGLPMWAAVIPASVLGIGMLLVNRWYRQAELARVKPTLLSAGRCASCAYPVAKLPPEADGCVSCPECGAAWKHDSQWARRLEIADAAAAAALGLKPDGSSSGTDDIQWFARIFSGATNRRALAMRDERGRLATLFFPRFPWKNPPCWDQVDPAERRSLKREVRLLGWPWRVFFGVCLSLFVAMQAAAFLSLAGRGPSFDLPTVLVGIWVFVFFPMALFGFVVFPYVRNPRQIATLFLRRGLCPCCWADLTKVPLLPDGVRECADCLAAWRLEGDGVPPVVSPDSTSPTHTPPNPPTAPRS